MLRVAARLTKIPDWHSRASLPVHTRRWTSKWTTPWHEPLNILFCGADAFSISSLRALHELKARFPEKVAGIDVVCRPDKLGGRSMNELRQVPIKPVANELGLKIHQLDTFTRWAPPTPVHLVVAVSFGLLVPGRILKNATYGGVNVHPSMLPDLRGPAPMIHTLLKRRQYTGVTLQTMHPKSFDNGAILDQTLAPGIGVPQGCTPDHLLKLLAPIGAQMLCNGIENGSFVQPTPLDALDSAETQAIDHAPKISSADRRINWENWTADEIILRDRVLGRLWDMETHARCSGYDKRIVFNGPWEKVASGASRPGTPIVVPGERRIGITTQDGYTVIPSAATIDGGKRGTGLQALLAHLTAVD